VPAVGAVLSTAPGESVPLNAAWALTAAVDIFAAAVDAESLTEFVNLPAPVDVPVFDAADSAKAGSCTAKMAAHANAKTLTKVLRKKCM
jgi:hypothetical protein